MDYTVVWSEEILDDIDALADYIARDSAFYAQQVVESILELGDSLVSPPAPADIYQAMLDQRARLKADQQLAEWTFMR